VAYPPVWRAFAAVLVAISRGGVPLLLAIVLFTRSAPILPLMLLRAFTILVVAPGTAAWLIGRALTVTVAVADGSLVLQRDQLRVEIPCDAVTRLSPWIIPLPGGGLWLRLRSGRRFRYGLQVRDPTPLLSGLAAAGVAAAAVTLQHPTMRYAHAKHSRRRWRWYHPLLQFVGFALLPTLPLFRLQQLVAYGGLFGQYYQQGLMPYLQNFALYWMTLTIYLVLYSGVWRGLAEAVALGAAWAAPSRAARVRRAAETGYRVLYYGGVPVLLMRFFLPW
jgi:hypothetical protein